MANTPISGLPSVTPPVSSSALVPIVQGGVTDSAQVSQLITGLPQATPSADGKMSAADKAKLDNATDANTAGALVKRDGSGNFTANIITAAQATITGTPVVGTDAANKAYVDATAAGLVIKAAVKVATTGSNYTLAGGTPSTLDGQSLGLNDRILVKDQSNATQNGLYYVTTIGSGANGTWTRSTDADTGAKLTTNSYVFVNSGTANGSTAWVMNTPGTIVLGTSNIVWVLFSQITQIPAANITGTIVGSQIAALAISTAKFAAGLTPVEIVSAMPTTANFQGRMVFLTTVDGSFAANKLYRWTDASTTGNTFWTSIVPAVDITGQITTTQITDSGITTAKLSSNCVTTGKLAAGAVTANELAANSVIAGKIQAGAITATEIAVGTIDKTRISDGTITTTQIAAGTILASNIAAGTITADRIVSSTITGTQIANTTITGSKIATGTITASNITAGTITANEIAGSTITAAKLNVSTLSSITANIGTITSGTINGATINAGSGTAAVVLDSSGLSIGSGRITAFGSGGSPWLRVYASGGVNRIEINGNSAGVEATMYALDNSGANQMAFNSNGLTVNNSTAINMRDSSRINLSTSAGIVGPGFIKSIGTSASDAVNFIFGEVGSPLGTSAYMSFILNGREVRVPITY